MKSHVDEEVFNLASYLALISGLTIMYGRSLSDCIEDDISRLQESLWESWNLACIKDAGDKVAAMADALRKHNSDIRNVYSKVVAYVNNGTRSEP